MNALVAILVFALLFGGFALVRRERDRAGGCHSCPEEEDSAACDACPLSDERRGTAEHLRLER